MAEDAWGDHVTLMALAEQYHIQILVITSTLGDRFVVDIRPANTQPKRTICLGHLSEIHYFSSKAAVAINTPPIYPQYLT
jgi:hypothetical protein